MAGRAGEGGEMGKAKERQAQKKSQKIYQFTKLHFIFCGLKDYRVTVHNKKQNNL